ncbi:hypothetical protein D3C78_1520680 [compost metagenome]
MPIDHVAEQGRAGEVAQAAGILIEAPRVFSQAGLAVVEVAIELVACVHLFGNGLQGRVAGVAADKAGVVEAVHAHLFIGHGRYQQQPIGVRAQLDLIDGFTGGTYRLAVDDQ